MSAAAATPTRGIDELKHGLDRLEAMRRESIADRLRLIAERPEKLRVGVLDLDVIDAGLASAEKAIGRLNGSSLTIALVRLSISNGRS